MAKLIDEDLITQVASGDRLSFLVLYHRHLNSIHKIVLRILHDQTLAEEVTQDTFFKLWSRAGQYLAERGPVLNWLSTIARHTALDCVRREILGKDIRDNDDNEDLLQDIPDAVSTTEEARWRSLHFAVQSLSDIHRQIIELIYFQGLSHVEISEVLGWPLGTVKTRSRAAMAQLRSVWVDG